MAPITVFSNVNGTQTIHVATIVTVPCCSATVSLPTLNADNYIVLCQACRVQHQVITTGGMVSKDAVEEVRRVGQQMFERSRDAQYADTLNVKYVEAPTVHSGWW